MNRSRLLVIIALTAAVLIPATVASSASASSTPSTGTHRRHVKLASVTSRDPATTALAIAETYWGAVPCAGQIALAADQPLVAGLTSDTDGWVTFNSSLGPDNLDAPAASYTDCVISLAHWRWSSWTAMEQDWGMFCLTVVHETGHLLGHKHSLVPGSVMAPVFTSDANVPPICNQHWLPGWRSAAGQRGRVVLGV